MNHQMQPTKIDAVILPQTFELLKDMQEGLNISMGEAIDRLALHIKAQDSDQAVHLIIEDISIVISELAPDQFQSTLCEVASTLIALLPPEAIGSLRQRALEKQTDILQGLMDLSDEKKLKMKELFERIQNPES